LQSATSLNRQMHKKTDFGMIFYIERCKFESVLKNSITMYFQNFIQLREFFRTEIGRWCCLKTFRSIEELFLLATGDMIWALNNTVCHAPLPSVYTFATFTASHKARKQIFWLSEYFGPTWCPLYPEFWYLESYFDILPFNCQCPRNLHKETIFVSKYNFEYARL
jgi:hypothetical protein